MPALVNVFIREYIGVPPIRPLCSCSLIRLNDLRPTADSEPTAAEPAALAAALATALAAALAASEPAAAEPAALATAAVAVSC
jgi:hypothetical protein